MEPLLNTKYFVLVVFLVVETFVLVLAEALILSFRLIVFLLGVVSSRLSWFWWNGSTFGLHLTSLVVVLVVFRIKVRLIC